MIFQKVFGNIQLLLAWFGQRYFVGVFFEEDAQSAVTAANVHGALEVFAVQQTTKGHLFSGMFVIAPLPIMQIVMAWVVILVCLLFSLCFCCNFRFLFHMWTSIAPIFAQRGPNL